ncbi:hypothetical protein ACP70R_018685 [Stipagrostis hirtigluma subsp. patula]
MEDAAGQPIHGYDLVTFETTGAQHGGRGVVLRAKPGRMFCVRGMNGAEVTVKACDVTVVDRTYFEGIVVVGPRRPGRDRHGHLHGAGPGPDRRRGAGGDRQGRVSSRSAARHRAQPGRLRGVRPVARPVAELSLDVDVLFEDGGLCRITGAEGKLRTLDKGAARRRQLLRVQGLPVAQRLLEAHCRQG